ncbi:MAG: hypothetical protein QOJ80_631 [Mycobacterium sp.]|nr:hypothetical protein [Mycobacterium sp.]
MLRAVYVRKLKPDITIDQFVESWMPEQHTRLSYPAAVSIAQSLTNPRQVISVFDVEVEASRFAEVLPGIVHPDSEARLASIVESTQLEGVFALVDQFGTGHADAEAAGRPSTSE